jgi:hypothetical protein
LFRVVADNVTELLVDHGQECFDIMLFIICCFKLDGLATDEFVVKGGFAYDCADNGRYTGAQVESGW